MNAHVLIVGLTVLLSQAYGQTENSTSTPKVRPCDVRGPHYLARTSNGQTDPKVVNGNIDPYVPEGQTVKENEKQESYRLEDVRVILSPVDPKVSGDTGENIRSQALCEGKELANASLLDFLFSFPDAIPKEWQDGRAICFLGTVYKDTRGYEYVHYLYHDGISVCWGRKGLRERWSESFHIVRVERSLTFQPNLTKN